MSILDDIQEKVTGLYEQAGVKVYVKTDITPEVLVYDADNVKEDGEPSESGLIKYKIRVTNRKGKKLVEYGKAPTNVLKVLVVGGVLLAGLFVTVKGLKGSYVQFKK